WEAFLERVPQASALPAPSARYAYSSFDRTHTAEFMQDVPFPTKLLASGRAALAEARAAHADLRERRNVLRMQAEIAYASLYLARREVEIMDENLTILGRFVETARTKYAAGTATQPDLL